MRRILVTGASGMLGRATLQELSTLPNRVVIGQAFTRSSDHLISADLTDKTALVNLIEQTSPDCIVHCAAERRPDVSEGDPAATDAINQHAVAELAAQCRERNRVLIYISTDYVFDGSQAPYQPTDTPNPLNHYGRSKLAGEKEALACGENAIILRVPVLYGPVNNLEESAITTIAKLLLDDTPKAVDHWATRYPTAINDVASVITQIIQYKSKHPDFHGIYHWSGNEAFTKYEMALAMGEIWQMDSHHLSPDSSAPGGAPRPKDCHLETKDLLDLGIQSFTPFKEAIAKAIAPFKPN